MTLSRRAAFYILAIIFAEGYLVLSTEILAIRIMLPYVGGGTDTISIIIAAVLLPLATGYYYGGQFKPAASGPDHNKSIRKKLAHNILLSSVFILFGLSFLSTTIFTQAAIITLTFDRLLITTLYSLVFIATPVFLLGQTTPLLSNFLSDEKLSTATGRILFISTLGSFIGATATTLILMAYIGVHNTVILNIALSALIFLGLNKQDKPLKPLLLSFGLIACGFFMNSNDALTRFGIVENGLYSTISIEDDPIDGIKTLYINNTSSSGLDKDNNPFDYIGYINDNFIKTLPPERTPANILVLGAGGFTVGLDDTLNSYDFVDIDKSLKEISEQYFLPEKLGGNKQFHPVPARGFLTGNKKKYDLIIVDVFLGHDIPEEMVTHEFFEQTRKAMKPNSFMIINIVTSPGFNDAFSRNFDLTLRSVFPFATRQIIGEGMYPWHPEFASNILYILPSESDKESSKIYTDDRNSSYADRPRRIWEF